MKVWNDQSLSELQVIKYHSCPAGHPEAILLVDVESESVLQTDQEGNRQYYCPACLCTFSVDSAGAIVPQK